MSSYFSGYPAAASGADSSLAIRGSARRTGTIYQLLLFFLGWRVRVKPSPGCWVKQVVVRPSHRQVVSQRSCRIGQFICICHQAPLQPSSTFAVATFRFIAAAVRRRQYYRCCCTTVQPPAADYLPTGCWHCRSFRQQQHQQSAAVQLAPVSRQQPVQQAVQPISTIIPIRSLHHQFQPYLARRRIAATATVTAAASRPARAARRQHARRQPPVQLRQLSCQLCAAVQSAAVRRNRLFIICSPSRFGRRYFRNRRRCCCCTSNRYRHCRCAIARHSPAFAGRSPPGAAVRLLPAPCISDCHHLLSSSPPPPCCRSCVVAAHRHRPYRSYARRRTRLPFYTHSPLLPGSSSSPAGPPARPPPPPDPPAARPGCLRCIACCRRFADATTAIRVPTQTTDAAQARVRHPLPRRHPSLPCRSNGSGTRFAICAAAFARRRRICRPPAVFVLPSPCRADASSGRPVAQARRPVTNTRGRQGQGQASTGPCQAQAGRRPSDTARPACHWTLVDRQTGPQAKPAFRRQAQAQDRLARHWPLPGTGQVRPGVRSGSAPAAPGATGQTDVSQAPRSNRVRPRHHPPRVTQRRRQARPAPDPARRAPDTTPGQAPAPPAGPAAQGQGCQPLFFFFLLRQQLQPYARRRALLSSSPTAITNLLLANYSSCLLLLFFNYFCTRHAPAASSCSPAIYL